MTTKLASENYTSTQVRRWSQFFHGPPEFFQGLLKGDTKASKFLLYSSLAVYFKSGGDSLVSERYLRMTLELSRDLFDDCNSPTTFQSGLGFVILTAHLATENFPLAKHYVSCFFLFWKMRE